MKTRIIPIEGVENFRDLGGYPARGNSTVAEGKFFRAAALHEITPKGKEEFNKLGIQYVVDLRSQLEVDQNPPNLEGLNDVEYVHLPMLDQLNSALAAGELAFPDSMLAMYQSILKYSTNEFREMFQLFANATGGILFHCTAGKDRTGVTAMLLYGLAGVPKEIIAEDYSYSEKLLNRQYESIPEEVPEYVLYTKAEYMMDTIQWVEDAYGSVIGYLTKIGVSQEEQKAVCRQMNVPYSNE